MRNHQQTDPEDATIAKMGDATFEREGDDECHWHDAVAGNYITNGDMIRYGATFWKPIVPEPGYRLVEDHERVGKKPKGCRVRSQENDGWGHSVAEEWFDELIYAVPIKQVVAGNEIPYDKESFVAWFANQEDRDRAVHDANERER